jgi:lantibiotic modifying enzyme
LQQKIFFPHIFLQESFSIEKFFRQELLQNKIYLNCSLDMEGLLKYEVNSLLHGQIPVFYMKINDNLIYDAYGKILGKTEKNPSDYILNQSINLDSFLAENLENIKVFF